MCGRADDDFGPVGWDTLDWLFGLRRRRPHRPRRAEVRPTDQLMFMRRAGQGWDAPDGRWGLVPHGMTLEQAKKYATFNARAESPTEKPMFRGAFQAGQRCVIPLAGFWEWPELHGKKTRTRIDRPDGKPLLVAGLWNRVETPDGSLESCTMVTRPPTPDLEHVHDRMPALLLSQDLDAWLEAPAAQARAAAMTGWRPGILRVTTSGSSA